MINATEKAIEIENFLKKGNVAKAAAVAIVSLSSTDDDGKDVILHSMAHVQVSRISDAALLSIVNLLATDDRASIPLATLEDTLKLLNKTTIFLQKYAKNHSDILVNGIGERTLRGLSNTMAASTDIAQNLGKDLTGRILSMVDELGSALLSIKTTGKKQSVYKSNTIILRLGRHNTSEVGGMKLGRTENEGRVVFPSIKVLFEIQEARMPFVDTQMVTFKDNPYVWTSNSKYIKSSVVSLDLKKLDGSRLNISGLTHPFELFIPGKESNDSIHKEKEAHFFVKPYNDVSHIQYHKIVLETRFDSAYVEIRPANKAFFDIFVSAGVKPKPDNYTFRTRIPDFSSCRNHPSGIGYLNCAKSPYTFLLSKNVTGSIGEHFIGIRLGNETNKGSKRNRLKRSCMGRHGRWKRSCVGVKDPPTTPTPSPKLVKPKYDNRTYVNYTMSVRIKNCLYWSDIKQDWTNEGCRVGQKEEKGYLQCLCTHLSAFGGRIFVAPNPIDFKKVWETLRRPTAESFVVLATVCVIFGIYFVGLVLARRADRKDKSKVAANVYLTDLNKEGYTYNISIQTGMWTGCGTTANVGIIINGEQGSSGVIPLTDPLAPRKCFTRGSVNKFTLILPFSLGNLTDINIWHDNNGSDPSWFLQYVFITDQLTEKVWYFFANKWLALDKRSGTIELYIKVAKEDKLTLFKPLFYARTARDLGEGHIWISVFTRPPQSPFTRCQRLSCCLSFLFTAMATSAMFYQFGRTPTDTFKFGPLEMSWTQIMIGIQSSVIAIPANLLVAVLFKNRKQKRPKEIYDPGERQRKSKPTGFLPPYFVYVAWCLCMLISLAGAAVTVMYSLAWGPDKSNQWLTSILVSLVQDVIVTQPIKVFLIAALLSLLLKKPPQQETGLGPSFFQSETAKNVMSGRPKEDELAEARDTNEKEWDMHETAKEVLSFLILSIILIVICYGNQHPARYQFTYSTSGVFRGFDEVKDTISLWKWVNNILLPGLYDVQWYNGNPFVQKEGFISNKKTFMMGMPRLRQIRIKTSNVCPADVMKIPVNYTFPRCFQEYSSANEDRTPFHLPRWIALENYSQLQSLNEICPKPWRYQSASQTDTLSHEAVTETFEGGGYIAELGYDNESASTVARDLRANNWVDERTAAVFIELTLFDPSTLLFCNVRNVFERLPTGHAVTSVDVRALPLYPSSSGNFQLFYEVCQLLFLVVIVLFFVAEMTKFFRQKRYLHQLWNWLELLLLVVSFASVALSFQKGKYTSLYVKKVKSNPYDTFSCDRIMVLLDLETVMLSAAIFIITLRLLRLIRFNRHVCQMRETLRSSASSILSFSLVFAVGIVAFTQLGYLCFGANLVNFSSFSKSLRMVLEMTLGHSIDGNEIHEKYPVLGPLYLFWLLIFVVFTLINVFVAILVGAYEKTREGQVDASFADADLGNFMYNVFLRKIKVLRNKVPLSKTSLGKSTSDQSGTIHPRLVNYSRLSSCLTKFRKYKSMNDIKPEALQPAESVTIRQEALHSLVVEDCFDQEEGGILDDLKTSLVEILSELELLLNGNSNKQVRFSCGELNKFGDKHQTSL